MNHAGPRLPSEPRHYERQANADLGLYDHIKIKKRKRRNASEFSQPEIMLDQLKLVVRLPPNGTEKHVEHGFGRRNNDLIQLIRNRQESLQEKNDKGHFQGGLFRHLRPRARTGPLDGCFEKTLFRSKKKLEPDQNGLSQVDS